MCITQGFAGQVLLHHVLIEARHHDGDESTAQKLFPEIVWRHPVVEDEDTTHPAVGNGADGLAYSKVQMSDDFQDDQHQRRKQADCLKAVCKHQRPDSASTGIEPDEQYHTHHIHDKGNACRLEHKLLEDNANHIESDGGAHHLRQQEEPRARQVGMVAQSLS